MISSSDQVKAAYLHKFPGYVEWPISRFASSFSPFVVGVAGAEDVYLELTKIAAGRPVQGRALEIRRLWRPDLAVEVHVVFVGHQFEDQLWAWLGAYRERPVLTVTETPGALAMGAVLNFLEVGNRVRFEASLGAAARAGIRLSSRLLEVAERVTGQGQ